jgi:hypothetical protein
MSYPVDVPPSPATAGNPVTTAIVAQYHSTSAADLATPSVLTQTVTVPPTPAEIGLPAATDKTPEVSPTENLGVEPATTDRTPKSLPTENLGVEPRRSTGMEPSPAASESFTNQTPATPLPPASQPANQPTTSNMPKTVTPVRTDVTPPELAAEGVIELLADRQSYDRDRQVFTAEGNVSMRFRNSLLVADRLQVNLLNRFAVAEGKVTMVRDAQTLQGDRFEYNFVQGTGRIQGVRGEIFIPEFSNDTVRPLANDITAGSNLNAPIGERVYGNQAPQNIQPGSPGFGARLGSRIRTVGQANGQASAQISASGSIGGTVNQLRFEADSAEFSPGQIIAENVRITNDPFSPPELELRSPKVIFTRLSPLVDEVKAEKPRLVFDQRFKLPLLRDRVLLDRRQRSSALAQIGYDSDDRGGLFIARSTEIPLFPNWRLVLTPQLLIQRAITDGFGLSSLGLAAVVEGNLGPRTTLTGIASFSSLDFSNIEDNFRGRFRAQQMIGTHSLSFDVSYRDRVFNNSLGLQNVRSSIGFVLASPVFVIGNTGITASYQANFGKIDADTDRLDLLPAVRSNNRVDLYRFQSSFALTRLFNLWNGKPLPATPQQGLRYTPFALVPTLNLVLGLNGVANLYSSGNSQNSIGGSIGLSGQFGHSAKDFLDYTAFNLTYSNSAISGLSPFLFDRNVDTQVLSAGLTQQVYGPWRLGVQALWNLDTGELFSIDYLLEYSRRTYSLLMRYNPEQKVGSINLQIRDLNWSGSGSEAFGGSGIRPISSGVERVNN